MVFGGVQWRFDGVRWGSVETRWYSVWFDSGSVGLVEFGGGSMRSSGGFHGVRMDSLWFNGELIWFG